jgi:hypothetical protein
MPRKGLSSEQIVAKLRQIEVLTSQGRTIGLAPLLGSRSGLSTAEEPMADVAAKLAELVAL